MANSYPLAGPYKPRIFFSFDIAHFELNLFLLKLNIFMGSWFRNTSRLLSFFPVINCQWEVNIKMERKARKKERERKKKTERKKQRKKILVVHWIRTGTTGRLL
jgi:hypothetical protein